YLARNQEVLGYIAFDDTIRENALTTLNKLREKMTFTILSGDKKPVVAKVAAQLGITHAEGEVLPEGKAEYIGRLKEQNFQVAMVGDGINDAAAMARADLGISLSTGNELASSQ